MELHGLRGERTSLVEDDEVQNGNVKDLGSLGPRFGGFPKSG